MPIEDREKLFAEIAQINQDFTENVTKALSQYDDFSAARKKAGLAEFIYKFAFHATSVWVIVVLGLLALGSLSLITDKDLGSNLFSEAIGAIAIFIILELVWNVQHGYISQHVRGIRCAELIEIQKVNLEAIAKAIDAEKDTLSPDELKKRIHIFRKEAKLMKYATDELERVHFEIMIETPRRAYSFE